MITRLEGHDPAQALQANVLQPPRSVAETNARLNALDELLAQEPLLDNLLQCLKAFPRDPDRACLGIAATSQGTAQSLHTGIQSLIWLRSAPLLAALHTGIQSPIWLRSAPALSCCSLRASGAALTAASNRLLRDSGLGREFCSWRIANIFCI